MVIASQAAATDKVQFVSDNRSIESQACLDAVSGKASLTQLAEKLGVNEQVLDSQVQCNGMAISKFVRQFEKKPNQENITLTENRYALNVKHANSDAQLCAIAASGDMAKLKRVTRAQGLNVKRFVKHNTCNDQPVSEFVRQFGGEQAAIELQKHI